MQEPTHPKRSVWNNIFNLLLGDKKRFFLVVFISLLSTGAAIIEPLIYREAINDIAGLFVRKAKEDTRKELSTVDASADSVDVAEEDPVDDFIQARLGNPEKEAHQRGMVAPRTPEQAIRTLMWAVGLILVVNLIGRWLTLVGDNLNVRFACAVEQNFIQSTFAHVLKLPVSFFSKRSSAALSKQINQSEQVSSIVNGFSQQILPELLSLTGILVIMFWQNVTLSLIALAVVPLYLLLAYKSANKLESGLSDYYDRWEQVATRMQDALGGIKTVKLSGAEHREVQQFKRISSIAYDDYVKRIRLSNRYIFFESVLTRASSAFVLGYGGYLTLEHQLTPGDVVMFVAYLDRLYSPIDALASLFVNLQQHVASIARAFKLLFNGEEEKKGKVVTIPDGRIEVSGLTFGYHPEKMVLNNLTFTIQPGQVTALIGPSGAGKTTVVDLLLKLYDGYQGQIRIDGIDLRELDPSALRAQIGMVAADGAIFRGTLADNIRYKRGDASDDEVLAAAHAAGLSVTLQRLPLGIKTLVGESGFGLSVGERQRIQIARVLVAKPKILVLDEATANLDYVTENEIRKTVEEIRKHHTVIVIAHRFSMVRDADHVIVLSQGTILEEGSVAELQQRNGWFARFAASASEG